MSVVLKNIQLPLARFSLDIDIHLKGRVTAICGPSGAGKTSLLDLVAGLRHPKSAFIQIGAEVLTDTSRRLFIPVHLRRIGYVPQDMALFPHLSARQNLLYGHRPGPETNILFALDRVVELLEIEPLLPRRPDSLSGGEKQRVSLARALLSSPRLLLLDEPLASLDEKLKARILPYLLRIRDEFNIPMLYVTHDRLEAAALADEIVTLEEGRALPPPKA